MPPNKAILEHDAKALQELPPIIIQMCGLEALIILSQLQLALRHPDNTSETAIIARKFAKEIAKHIGITASLRKLIELGWKP